MGAVAVAVTAAAAAADERDSERAPAPLEDSHGEPPSPASPPPLLLDILWRLAAALCSFWICFLSSKWNALFPCTIYLLLTYQHG